MAQKPSSNTMELNSILEEARSKNKRLTEEIRSNTRSGSAKPAAKTAAPAAKTRSVSDGYVDISSGAYPKSAPASKPKPRKKSKAPVVITVVVIVLILAVAGVAGFMYYRYQNSGSAEVVADRVSVNGVDLSGMTMQQAKAAMTGIEQQLADSINVRVAADTKNYTLTKDDFTYSFNTEEVFNQVKAHSEEKAINKDEKKFEITMQVDTSNAQAIADKIAKDVHVAPTDARVSDFDTDADDMFTFEKEVTGKDVDSAELVNAINGVFVNGNTSGDIQATVKTVEPKRTVQYLESHIVKLSEFSTYSTNNSNGNENMRVSLAACDGSIIDPGETWSFNDCTGDSNLESNGYLPAGVIVQGRSETGIGGGICQSSTTIYNAGLLCGMTVVERACHYYKSTYVDAGRDATIDYGNIDLKLENPFDYQLFMRCWMDGAELHCEMYGLENPNFDEITISTSDPEYFATGYSVDAWRTYYKNDEKVDEDDLPRSTYYTVAPSSGDDSAGSVYNNDTDDSDSGNDGDGGNGGNGGYETPDTPGDGGEAQENPGGGNEGGNEGGGNEGGAEGAGDAG